MRRRPCRGADDVLALMEFQADAIAAGSHLGLMHPGDVSHRLRNQSVRRGHSLSEIVAIWEGSGRTAAWVLLWPSTSMKSAPGFDLQVHPAARDGHPGLEDEALEWAEAALGGEAARLETDWYAGDEPRRAALARRGWSGGRPFITVNRIEIGPSREVRLPPGYQVRAALGVE